MLLIISISWIIIHFIILKQNIIFERFRQADHSITRTSGGTGIGLSISKKLTDSLGGQIWFNSEENKGTVFYITLPHFIEKETADPEKHIPKKDQNFDFSGETFLIAEDDKSSLHFIKEIIVPTKAKIITAENGHEALNIFNENGDISLVPMDTDISGIEITKMNNSLFSPKDIYNPIQFVSVYSILTSNRTRF